MTVGKLTSEILKSFEFLPTEEQFHAITTFSEFVMMSSPDIMMLMRGSAGTGKTELASAMVRTLHRLGQKVMLMAPTGRAAKVFAINSGRPAFTIHRKIYRQRSYAGNDTKFNIADNMHRNTLFIVDEASMISNATPYADSLFGSGRLLDDLISYVYSGHNCHLMLIGDMAQLPPIGEEGSPALDIDNLKGYGLLVMQADLNKVLRQSNDSGILFNATVIRQMITRDDTTELPMITLRGFADVCVVKGDELIEQIAGSYAHVGQDSTMIITRSNKRANIYNQGIRNMILGREEELTTGDRLMVVKNNYHWTRNPNRQNEADTNAPTFLANGDVATVQKVEGARELFGFRFAKATLRFPDYDNYELSLTMLLDSLTSESPSLTPQQHEQLYRAVMEDYTDLSLKAERMKAIREDAYFNALQVKYAYAITCHKAQGGQWEHVYLDQGYITEDMVTPEYIHWLYTAFTRATDKLYLVNWPEMQILP